MITVKKHNLLFAVPLFLLFSIFVLATGAQADQNQFIDNGDGTVYDAKTGLTWQKYGPSGLKNWSDALAYVESLNGTGFGGCSGWVLPTSKELKRIVDHSKSSTGGEPLIDAAFFPDTAPAFYWTSSSHKDSLKYAVSFANGHQRKMSSSNLYNVRAVRGECDPADADGDGYLPGDDCNDNDPNINPGATEICDGYVDNNCDGEYDLTCWDEDWDNDGWSINDGDCDDNDPNNFPTNPEVCDGFDNDCDLVADNGLTFDLDGDGYTSIDSCEGTKNDCDDNDPTVHPGAAEICGDLVDQDCVGGDLSCLDVDNDGDGLTENQGDCNDNDPNVRPGVAEVICDGVDNDCNPSSLDVPPDGDNDGVTVCAGDCDDADPANFPGNGEVCDGADNNCNTLADEGLPILTSYPDGDNDSFGNPGLAVESCAVAAGYVLNNTDCNDADSSTYPGAAEICNDGRDNNCNTVVDDGCPANVQLEGSSNLYGTVQEAYDAISISSGAIKMQAVTIAGPIFDKPVTITLKGGFDDDTFTTASGWTIFSPSMIIRDGLVIAEYIIIQ